jgi:hypothetical protein
MLLVAVADCACAMHVASNANRSIKASRLGSIYIASSLLWLYTWVRLSDSKTNFGATEPHFVELEEARAEWRRPAS